SNSPPMPTVELTIKRVVVRAAASKRSCSKLFTKTRGSFKFEFRSCNRSWTGPGTAVLTPSDNGPSICGFAVNIWRFAGSLGSLTSSDASRGALAHALTSSAVTHAIVHLLHSRARRIYFFPAADDWCDTAQMASTRAHAPWRAASIQPEL